MLFVDRGLSIDIFDFSLWDMEMPWGSHICSGGRFAIRIGGETGGAPPTFTTFEIRDVVVLLEQSQGCGVEGQGHTTAPGLWSVSTTATV